MIHRCTFINSLSTLRCSSCDADQNGQWTSGEEDEDEGEDEAENPVPAVPIVISGSLEVKGKERRYIDHFLNNHSSKTYYFSLLS